MSVTIRRLGSADYDAVVRLASELDVEERYMRFLTRHPPYIGEWALSLTAPAPGTVGLGAFEAGELCGVASYSELVCAGVAEVSVVVAHEQHHRGIGTALLRELGRIAKAAGLHVLVADVLVENHAMRDVVRDAGWAVRQHRDGELLRFEFDLDESAQPR